MRSLELLSVVAPMHNEEESVGRVVASLFAQNLGRRLVVIGVDDGTCRGIYEELQQLDEQVVIGISGERAVPGGVYVENGVLIDDSDDSRVLLSQIIEETGCRVFTAVSGEAGISAALDRRPARRERVCGGDPAAPDRGPRAQPPVGQRGWIRWRGTKAAATGIGASSPSVPRTGCSMR